ncbi:hypothetical protein F4802DRAFT_87518 [Xylaria palmicola]|nr:hypothetical protein F4802DRAFT_87518 [Xylaria palmicola]
MHVAVLAHLVSVFIRFRISLSRPIRWLFLHPGARYTGLFDGSLHLMWCRVGAEAPMVSRITALAIYTYERSEMEASTHHYSFASSVGLFSR